MQKFYANPNTKRKIKDFVNIETKLQRLLSLDFHKKLNDIICEFSDGVPERPVSMKTHLVDTLKGFKDGYL